MDITPATGNLTGYTVTREIRGGTAHWVHVTGYWTLDLDTLEYTGLEERATYKAGAEARKWAKELGKGRAYRVSSSGSRNCEESGGLGTFLFSVCYGFSG